MLKLIANIEIHFHLLQAKFFATQLRPSSAPVRRIISLMDNQEPVFATTDQMSDPQIKDVYPHKVGLEYRKFSFFSFLIRYIDIFIVVVKICIIVT